MKRCPTCNRTFTDPSLSFCIEDGTPLVKAFAPAPDSEATIVVPSSAKTQIDAEAAGSAGEGSAPSDWKAPAYQPPGQFAPPPAVRKRRAWPWVVGIVVLLLIGVAGIGIAAVIVIPNMMRAAENNSNVNANTERNLNGNRSSNVNTNANANSFVGNENENMNANENTNPNAGLASEPPTDEEEVLSDLTDLEKEWTEANFSADKKKLARILADDYVATQQDGTIQGKADYLRDIKPDKTVKDWELKDLKLTLKGDRATLKGRMREEREGQDQDSVLQFTDKFVWRDERWQAVASEVSQAK
jgi:hypothetical protein